MARMAQLHVNGKNLAIQADAERSLLSVLRDDLDLTGAKYGCGEGQCGACTVLVDGVPRRACVTTVGSVESKRITTIEGLERDGKLHPLQQAFLDCEAMQCGYCTPGMILAGVGLLGKNPNPAPQEIARSMEGNVCRCGTYSRIVLAIRKAAEAVKGGGQ